MRLRRPAADPSGVAGGGGPTPWIKGEEVLLREVDPRDLCSGQVIVIQGLYFGNIVKLAAVVQKAEVEKGETYLQVKAQGTNSEDLLKVHSGAGGPSSPIPDTLLPSALQPPREWGSIGSREDWLPPGGGCSSGRLGQQLGVCHPRGRREGGRTSRTTPEGEGLGSRGPTWRGRKEEGPEEVFKQSIFKKQAEEEEEGEKEREVQEKGEKRGKEEGQKEEAGCEPRWEESRGELPEKFARLVRGHWNGSSREDTTQGGEKSKEICSKEEGEDIKQQLFVRVQQQGDREGGQPSRGAVQGDQPGSSDPRTLSRGAVCRVSAEHVGESTYGPRRRDQRRRSEGSRPVVLQAGASEKGQCTSSEGDPQLGNRHRPPGKRKTCTGRGRLDPEVEGAGDGSSWRPLVSVPKNGSSSGGVFNYSSSSRTTPCPKRDPSRQQDQVPHRDGPQLKLGEGKRQNQEGIKGSRRKRERRSGHQEGWQRQRKGSGYQVRSREVEDDDSCGAGVEGQVYEDGATLSRSEPGKCQSVEKEEKFAGLGRELPLHVFQGADQGLLTPPSQQYSSLPELIEVSHGLSGTSRLSEEKDASSFSLEGLRMKELGQGILQRFLEVLPFRSKPTGGRDVFSVFPLPTSTDVLGITFPDLGSDDLTWLLLVSLGLNSIWGGDVFNDSTPSQIQTSCLRELASDVRRLCSFDCVMEHFLWEEFFKHRSVDYQGEEVKIARAFKWENISPALPVEVGRVPLEGVCTLGCKFYVENFDLYVKPRDEWPPISKPRVMVKDEDWGDVCKGLVSSGVCCLLPRDDVFEGPDGPLVNGMFGVTKDELCNGVEVFRLIMNLIPLNSICYGIEGDVGTLPSWSMMSPFVLQP